MLYTIVAFTSASLVDQGKTDVGLTVGSEAASWGDGRELLKLHTHGYQIDILETCVTAVL